MIIVPSNVAAFQQVTLKAVTGSTTASSSISIPTHAVDDLIIICAYTTNNGSITKPSASGTVPTWTDIGTSTTGMRLAYAKATATTTTSGTWTNATGMAAAVFSGQKSTSPIGGNAFTYNNVASTTVTAPAITLTSSNGSSQIIHFAGAVASATWSTGQDSGYTEKFVTTTFAGNNRLARIITKDSTTSDGQVTVGTLSTNYVNFSSCSVEVLAP